MGLALYEEEPHTKKSRDPIELLCLVGLETAADKKVEEFSKGMRMRLNFVRAFQHDPKLLFLDEPTAGLDPVNARMRVQGKTIVLTTHNMNDVDELCDRVSFMVDGNFAAIDVPDALKAKFGRRHQRLHLVARGVEIEPALSEGSASV